MGSWVLSGDDPDATLRSQGFACLSPADLVQRCAVPLHELIALHPSWRNLPPDAHLRDAGAYRRRRHGSFVLTAGVATTDGQATTRATLTAVAHRAHWQPTAYNALHGGFARWFEPIEPQVATAHSFTQVLLGLGRLFSLLTTQAVAQRDRWFIEAHQFRIDTAGGIGRPTPEGAHRDGVDFVAVILVNRSAVRGGETRVFQAASPEGVRFTLDQPWSALLLDDARVIHETTPIQPDMASASASEDRGTRDTLVVTFRRDGFQDP